MKNLITLWITILSVALPASSFAHPGHGTEDPWSPLHYLQNPQHSLVLGLIILAVAVTVAWKVWKNNKSTTRK